MFKIISSAIPIVAPAGGSFGSGSAGLGAASQTSGQVRRQPLLCDELLNWCDRYRHWLFLLVAAFYLAAFNGQWRMEPDAALYLSIGRNLARGQGFTYLGQPNHLAYPGWPGLIAITFKLFGTRSLVPVHVLMLLMAWAALGLTYRLFRLHAGRPTAVAVTVGLGLTKTFFCYGFELWSDMPFTVGVMAFLAGYEAVIRRAEARLPSVAAADESERAAPPGVHVYDWLLLAGGLAMAIVMRPTMWPLLAAIFLTILYRAIRQQMRWPTLLIAAALLIAFAAVVMMMDPRRSAAHAHFSDVYERAMLMRFTAGPPGALRQTILTNADELLRRAASDALVELRVGSLNMVLGLVVLGLGVSLFRYRPLWGLWFCLLMVALMATNPIVRYFLPVIPLLVYAWWRAIVAANHRLPQPWGNLVFAALLVCGTAVNGSKVIGVIVQQQRRPFLSSYDRSTYAAIPQVVRQLRTAVPANAVVFARAPYGRVTSYLSERTVVGTRELPFEELQRRRIYLLEPVGDDVRGLLTLLGLSEGPALFTVHAPPHAGPDAVDMSLHSTAPLGPSSP
jgi:hypothetical protein